MKRKTHEPFGRRKTIRKVLRVIMISVLLFCLVSMAASAVFFRVMFHRQSGIPRLHFAYEELPDPPARSDFSFLSGKNLLRGWRYDAEDPRGLVVVVNGIGSGADEHLAEIVCFLEHGYSVVTWDATGVGRSEGSGIVGLQQIRRDLRAFLAYRRSTAEELPMVLYSHSAGAYAAAMSLPEDDTILGAVCIAGFDRPVQILYHHGKQTVGPLADLEYPFLRLENRLLFGPDADASARAAIDATDTSVLLVGGSSDDLVPRQYSLALAPTSYRNPNVRCVEIAAPFRSEHAAAWLSPAAAEYLFQNGKTEHPDKARASELDPGFMALVLDFFDSVVGKLALPAAA